MPYGVKRSKVEIEEFKNQIIQYMGLGLNHKEIMVKLKLPNNTFYRIFKYVKQDLEEEFMSKRSKIVLNILQRDSMRIKLAHTKGLQTQEKYWLNLAHQMDDSLFQKLQSMGVIQKEPEKMDLNIEERILDAVKRAREIKKQ